MNILITADLHLNIPARNKRTGRSVLEDFAEAVRAGEPDAVVVAGDLGIPEESAKHLRPIREAAGDIPLAVTLGNHDFWLPDDLHSHFGSLEEIVGLYWAGPARDCGIVLLDAENLAFDDIVIAGGYGHFDLGLAYPDLELFGVKVTTEEYLSGWAGRCYWNDFGAIPHCACDLQKGGGKAGGCARRSHRGRGRAASSRGHAHMPVAAAQRAPAPGRRPRHARGVFRQFAHRRFARSPRGPNRPPRLRPHAPCRPRNHPPRRAQPEHRGRLRHLPRRHLRHPRPIRPLDRRTAGGSIEEFPHPGELQGNLRR